MKKIVVFLLLCALLLFAAAQAEGALPVLHLDAAQLDYVLPRAGRLTVGDFSTPVTVKYRGMYSATFAGKRNYSLHLKDEAGAQRKISLLGLRADDDYVLWGGLSDMSRLRAPVGLALWRALGHPAPAAAACELYFADYYKGVYFLIERPDRKSAGLSKAGALYRVLAAAAEGVDLFSAQETGAPRGETWYNVGKVYPDNAEGWQPLAAWLAAEDRTALMDPSAFADYYLFVNLIGASDNMEKNLFLCWDGARFYPMPWDLDAAFGRLYTAAPAEADAWYSSPFFDALLQRADFQSLLRERWAALRETLSPDAILQYFEAWYDLLAESGAWARELERFPSYTDVATGVTYTLDARAELDFIRAYLTARCALLNAAFAKELTP